MRIIDTTGLLNTLSVETVRTVTKVSLQIAEHENNHKSHLVRTLHIEPPKRMQRQNQQHEVECNVGYGNAEEEWVFLFATTLDYRIPVGPDGDTLQDARHGDGKPPCNGESTDEQDSYFQGSFDGKYPTVESEDREFSECDPGGV